MEAASRPSKPAALILVSLQSLHHHDTLEGSCTSGRRFNVDGLVLSLGSSSSRQTIVRSKAVTPESPGKSSAATSSRLPQLTATSFLQQRIAYIDSEQPQRPSQASTSKPILPISHPATLTDSHSRHHSYLRISLTEKCSFRCTYCMPAEGVPLTPDDRLLSTQEVKRIARVFVQMGVKKIRLTGGEPTLRKDLVEIVRYLDSLRSEGLESIGLTTNGLVLSRMLPDLVAAGLTHVNISIDSLQPDRFASISRMSPKVLQKVLTTIDEALLYQPRLKVKLNVVVMKGMNDDEVNDFVELTRHRNLDVRFIEYMPFNSNAWSTEALLPAAELLQRVQAVHPVARHVDEANDTTRHYAVQGFAGRFGFISSMTDHFCASCNRVRVLADGNLKVCLFGNKEVSLRDALRTGHDDEALGSLISQALDRKHFKHAGMKDPKEIWEAAEGRGAGGSLGREMSRIGG